MEGRLQLSQSELIRVGWSNDEKVLDRLLEICVSNRLGLHRDVVRDLASCCGGDFGSYARMKNAVKKRLIKCTAHGELPPELGLRRTMTVFKNFDLAYVVKHLIATGPGSYEYLRGDDAGKSQSLTNRFLDFCMDPETTKAPSDLNIFAAILLSCDENRVLFEVMKIFRNFGFLD